MNKNLFSKIFFILFLVFTLMIQIFSLDFFHKKSEKINLKNFEQVLYSKENRVDEVLKLLYSKIKLRDYQLINNILIFDISFKELSENDIYFAVYSYDTLRFWSDNRIVLPDILDDNFQQNIEKVGNSWYEIRRLRYGSYLILGFIKIKDEFPFNNKFLKDKFAKGFDFVHSEFSISLIPVSYGFDIKSPDGSYLFTLVPVAKEHSNLNREDNILFIVFFLLALWSFLGFLAIRLIDVKAFWVLIIFLFLIGLRLLMIFGQLPIFLYSNEFFRPLVFSYSLGDLLIDIPLILLFLFVLGIRFNYEQFRPEKNYILFDLVSLLVINLFTISLLYFLFDFFHKLIIGSNLSFEIFRINSLSLGSVIIILFIGILLASFLTFYYLIIKSIVRFFSVKFILFIQIVLAVVIYFVNLLFIRYNTDFIKLFSVIPLFLLVIYAKGAEHYLRLFLIIIISTVFFLGSIILISIYQKIRVELKYQATHIDFFRDFIAEQILIEDAQKIISDDFLHFYFNRLGTESLYNQIFAYLKLEYFSGYLNKYNFNLKICTEQDYQLCQQSFYEQIREKAIKLSDRVYFVSKQGDVPKYLMYIEKNRTVLILEFVPTVTNQQQGYPELLIVNKEEFKNNKDFKYAVYSNGHLIYKLGDFIYPVDEKFWKKYCQSECYVSLHGFMHYLSYDNKLNYLIVVSTKKISLYDIILTYSYLLFSFLLISVILLFGFGLIKLDKGRDFSFKTKFLIFMIGILTGAFIIIGISTVAITIDNYKRKFDEKIKNTLTRSSNVIEKVFLQSSNGFSTDINYWAKNIADLLNTDINIYNSEGKLIATSRKKIYEYNLLSRFISYQALEKLLKERQVEYVEQETIGSFIFTSAYTVIVNNDREISGFINIPYFANSQAIRKEVLDLLITLGNIYIVMFLLTVLIAFLLSEQIIAPLKELQEKLKHLKVGHKYEKIDYKRRDEIGNLVEEYNNMVEKLEESIHLLAKSEREDAWRDIARQVAHEIKNPLTPMKLSIQLLQKAWENQDEDFGERLSKVTHTLIEQIENLRNTAEEFSDFAKISQSKVEKIDLAQKIENLVKLYENLENVDVKAIIKNRPVYIKADNKQISRALINLIKNAIQAIPEGRQGIILIELEKKDNKALVKVIDNGSGIPEEVRHKLFTPSFTTKSSGMGLGLSMVKNIVQNAKGKIWFDTELGRGSTFYLEFPLFEV